MIEEYDFRSDNQDQTDKTYEIALRPKHFKDFAGQPQVVENLSIFVSAARMREESLDHVLLHGPPGLGKTTLAQIIANEMQVGIKISSGPVLVMVLRKENAIADNRKIMGATNPQEADPGTIRKEFGISIDKNSIHGSDSKENAEKEISFFFKD